MQPCSNVILHLKSHPVLFVLHCCNPLLPSDITHLHSMSVCSLHSKVLNTLVSELANSPAWWLSNTSILLESRLSGSSTIPIQLDYKPPSPRCQSKIYQILLH